MTQKPTKKVKALLDELGIKVANGYFTKIPSEDLHERINGVCCAAYTGWNERGEVVVVLVKPRKCKWRLKS